MRRLRTAHAGPGQPEPGGGARRRQQPALDQRTAHEHAAAGAERGADREVLRRARGPGQQQVRDIGAGDEQHEHDRAERAATTCRRCPPPPDRAPAPGGRPSPCCCRDALAPPRARSCPSLPAPALSVAPGASRPIVCAHPMRPCLERTKIEGERRPHLHLGITGREAETSSASRRPLRTSARRDRGVLPTASRRPPKSALPRTVTEERQLFVPGLLLFVGEHSPGERRHPQHAKQCRRRLDAGDVLGLGAGAERETAITECAQARERARARPPIEIRRARRLRLRLPLGGVGLPRRRRGGRGSA